LEPAYPHLLCLEREGGRGRESKGRKEEGREGEGRGVTGTRVQDPVIYSPPGKNLRANM